jgi:hypothetical protein
MGESVCVETTTSINTTRRPSDGVYVPVAAAGCPLVRDALEDARDMTEDLTAALRKCSQGGPYKITKARVFSAGESLDAVMTSAKLEGKIVAEAAKTKPNGRRGPNGSRCI